MLLNAIAVPAQLAKQTEQITTNMADVYIFNKMAVINCQSCKVPAEMLDMKIKKYFITKFTCHFKNSSKNKNFKVN